MRKLKMRSEGKNIDELQELNFGGDDITKEIMQVFFPNHPENNEEDEVNNDASKE